MFQHFIITQFNTKFIHHKKIGSEVPTEDWMIHRFNFFNKICYPSIENQSNQNFEWLVFFDKETTDTTGFNKYPKMIPILMYDYDDWNYKYINRYLRPRIKSDTKWIITTRLDNDDALHYDYIKDVQERFNGEEILLNYTDGYIYNIESEQVNYFNYVVSNPFITLIEKTPIDNNMIKTCNYTTHPYMQKVFQKINISTNKNRPMWLQIIHDKNIGNVMRGKQLSIFDLGVFHIKP